MGRGTPLEEILKYLNLTGLRRATSGLRTTRKLARRLLIVLSANGHRRLDYTSSHPQELPDTILILVKGSVPQQTMPITIPANDRPLLRVFPIGLDNIRP